jgi:hypothetical protein
MRKIRKKLEKYRKIKNKIIQRGVLVTETSIMHCNMYAHIPSRRFLCVLQYSHLVKEIQSPAPGIDIHNSDIYTFAQLQALEGNLNDAMVLFSQRG